METEPEDGKLKSEGRDQRSGIITEWQEISVMPGSMINKAPASAGNKTDL